MFHTVPAAPKKLHICIVQIACRLKCGRPTQLRSPTSLFQLGAPLCFSFCLFPGANSISSRFRLSAFVHSSGFIRGTPTLRSLKHKYTRMIVTCLTAIDHAVGNHARPRCFSQPTRLNSERAEMQQPTSACGEQDHRACLACPHCWGRFAVPKRLCEAVDNSRCHWPFF